MVTAHGFRQAPELSISSNSAFKGEKKRVGKRGRERMKVGGRKRRGEKRKEKKRTEGKRKESRQISKGHLTSSVSLVFHRGFIRVHFSLQEGGAGCGRRIRTWLKGSEIEKRGT